MPSIRTPKQIWADAQRLVPTNAAQWAALVHDISDDTDKVGLPGGPRVLRYAGVLIEGNVAGKTAPGGGQKAALQKLGRTNVLLAGQEGGPAKSALPGDWAVIHNNSGHVSAYVLGSGSAMLLGQFRTKYTNSQNTPVPIELEQIPMLLIQPEMILGAIDTITANNTRNLTMGGAENNGDYILWTAPWDGTLRGFRLDLEAAAGAAGVITGRVRIRPPGGAWATAQISGADWTLALDAGAGAVSAEDAISSGAIASTKSLAIVKGTKVGLQVDKNAAVANVSQLRGRLIFY